MIPLASADHLVTFTVALVLALAVFIWRHS